MGKIEVMSGIHVGGNKDRVEIGGIDSPVIRDPRTSWPYIPGSSLKGKLRMISELASGRLGTRNKQMVCDCGKYECPVCRIFGCSAEQGKNGGDYIGPTRLIVRDCFPDSDTVKMWESLDSDYLFTEAKTENSINRLTSEANPRTIERVVRGSYFNFHFVLGKYVVGDNEDSDSDIQELVRAMRILEDSGIGGNVSRGYGRIRFKIAAKKFVSVEDYIQGGDAYSGSRYEDMDEMPKDSLKPLKEFAS